MRRLMLFAVLALTVAGQPARGTAVGFDSASTDTLEKPSPTGTATASASADAATGRLEAHSHVTEVLPEGILVGRDFAAAVARLTAVVPAAASTSYAVSWTLGDLRIAVDDRREYVVGPPLAYGAASGVFATLRVRACTAAGACGQAESDDVIINPSGTTPITLTATIATDGPGPWELRVEADLIAQSFVSGPGRASADVTTTTALSVV